jgi:hypothetical protein
MGRRAVQPEGKLVPLGELIGVVVDRKTVDRKTAWIETQRNPTTADGSIHERVSLVTYRIRHARAPALNPIGRKMAELLKACFACNPKPAHGP